MRLLSWNVNGRVETAARRQLDAVLAREADVIALQEVKVSSYADWCRGRLAAGYSVISAVDLVALPYPPPPYPPPPYPAPPFPPPGGSEQVHRTYFNLLAARQPIAQLRGLSFADADEALYAFPEKFVAARVVVDDTEVDVHNAHLPPGVSRGEVKVHHFEAIRRRADQDPSHPRVLCGDFNAPWSEDADGPLIDGAPEGPDEPSRWVKAEASIVANPEMRDVYRDVHKVGEPFPASHFTGQKEPRTPHRYDYIFASRELTATSCDYLTAWMEIDGDQGRLSDHAAVEADLAPAT